MLEINAITLITADMAAALRFWAVLDLEIVHGGPDSPFTSLRIGSNYVNLVRHESSNTAFWGRVIFHVPSPDEVWQRFTRAGYESMTEPVDAPWGNAISTSWIPTVTNSASRPRWPLTVRPDGIGDCTTPPDPWPRITGVGAVSRTVDAPTYHAGAGRRARPLERGRPMSAAETAPTGADPSGRSAEAVRAEVRAWLTANWDRGLDRVAWLALVADSGWAAPSWPTAWYGRGLDPELTNVVLAEFRAVGADGTAQDKNNLWANTVLAFGSDALKREFLRPLLLGQVGMCLLYSEPGAGSDLAAVQTRAERDGDEWVVNRQKVWTSSGRQADYALLIARTDWDAPKHRGISFFWFPMRQPGVEVRPLRQATGDSRFNEVFLTEAGCPTATCWASRTTVGWSCRAPSPTNGR